MQLGTNGVKLYAVNYAILTLEFKH